VRYCCYYLKAFKCSVVLCYSTLCCGPLFKLIHTCPVLFLHTIVAARLGELTASARSERCRSDRSSTNPKVNHRGPAAGTKFLILDPQLAVVVIPCGLLAVRRPTLACRSVQPSAPYHLLIKSQLIRHG
jgi:hypothetical protein